MACGCTPITGIPQDDPSTYINEEHVHEQLTVSVLERGLSWCLFPNLRSNKGNKHQNGTRVSAEKVRHESTCFISFLTGQNESINHDKNDVLYTPSTSHSLGFRSADDVTIDC